MRPATLHTMRPVLRPRPLRPIYKMTPWRRRQRCGVVLRTITPKAHPDGASTYALAAFVLLACFSGTPEPAGTLFQVICSSAREVFLFISFLYRSFTIVTADEPHRPINRLPIPPTATLPSCLWSRRILPLNAFCYGRQNKSVKNRALDSALVICEGTTTTSLGRRGGSGKVG